MKSAHSCFLMLLCVAACSFDVDSSASESKANMVGCGIEQACLDGQSETERVVSTIEMHNAWDRCDQHVALRTVGFGDVPLALNDELWFYPPAGREWEWECELLALTEECRVSSDDELAIVRARMDAEGHLTWDCFDRIPPDAHSSIYPAKTPEPQD